MKLPNTLPIREAAKRVGMGVPRLRKLIEQGKLKAYRAGGSDAEPWLRIDVAELEQVKSALVYVPAGEPIKSRPLRMARAASSHVHPAFQHL
jgi:excisionase family DNA binding protein